jgi:hypothetical protein
MKKENTTKTEFITSESEHWYTSEKKKNTWYPSVTTILSVFPKGIGFNKYLTAQVSWESSQEILKTAAKRGTNVHKGTELLEEGVVLSREFYTLEEWQMLEGFVKWWREYNPILIHKELGIVSDKIKTGGTIDRIYSIDGSLVLLDIKTSGAIHDNYWVQVAAYVKLFEEKHKEKIDYVAILRLAPRKKSGYEYVIKTKEDFQRDFKIFKASQETWNYINPKAQPKLLEVPLTLSLN